jgi:hypothetical protein
VAAMLVVEMAVVTVADWDNLQVELKAAWLVP